MSTIAQSVYQDIEMLPEAPGVYFFHDPDGNILYIGKATSLKDRVKSYLSNDLAETRGVRIVSMIREAEHVTYTQTDSVLEALVLEAALIKKHQPPFNTRDKDNKSFNYVVITNEDYPRVLIERGRTIPEKYDESDIKYSFGPFVGGGELKKAVKILRRIFPFRDTCTPYDELPEKEQEAPRPCFNAQLGLCPGVCTGVLSKQVYARNIQNLRLFFEGRKKKVLQNLSREMKEASAREDFERAKEVRDTIFALEHINDTALLTRDGEVEAKYAKEETDVFRVEGYDISHTAGEHVMGVMVVIEEGRVKKSDYRRFRLRGREPGDVKALREIITRRLKHTEWPLPNLIVADGGRAQKRVLESVVSTFINQSEDESFKNTLRSLRVVAVVKDERHRPKQLLGEKDVVHTYETEILLANQEAHRFALAFHRNARKKGFIKGS